MTNCPRGCLLSSGAHLPAAQVFVSLAAALRGQTTRFERKDYADVGWLAWRVSLDCSDEGQVSLSLRSSVSRALRKLARDGRVREHGIAGTLKFWQLTETYVKQQKKHQAEERRREKSRPEWEARHEAEYGAAEVEIRAEMGIRERSTDLDQLAKILGMLGSGHEGERAAAGLKAEAVRKRIGKSWEEILGVAPGAGR